MITGLNHLTIAVSDLDRSFAFYVDVLGFKPEGRWDKGAYLSAKDLWLCLSLEPALPAKDYTHYAFSIEQSNFDEGVAKIENAGAVCWKTNASEGFSYYFLDPDGHKLELHSGTLASRLSSVRSNPYSGWELLATNDKIIEDRYPSPCIKECCLNTEDICLGCYRAIDEIVGWGNRSDEEKKEILQQCARRKNNS